MKFSRKTTLLSLLASFVLFTSGFCTVPMVASASSHTEMPGIDMINITGESNGVQDINQVNGGCSTCKSSQSNLNACSFSCGSSLSKTATVAKKASISIDLLLHVIGHDATLASLLAIDEPGAPNASPPDSSGTTEILLSVAKKE